MEAEWKWSIEMVHGRLAFSIQTKSIHSNDGLNDNDEKRPEMGKS
jgi:hypothetical protein